MQSDISRTIGGSKEWHVKLARFVIEAKVFTTDAEVITHVLDVIVCKYSANFTSAFTKVFDFRMVEDKGFRSDFDVSVFHFIGHTCDGDAGLGIASFAAFKVDGSKSSVYTAVTCSPAFDIFKDSFSIFVDKAQLCIEAFSLEVEIPMHWVHISFDNGKAHSRLTDIPVDEDITSGMVPCNGHVSVA